jgi:hypothetical protein
MIGEWLEIVTDPSHISAELTFRAIELSVEFLVIRKLYHWSLNRRDRKHGHKEDK